MGEPCGRAEREALGLRPGIVAQALLRAETDNDAKGLRRGVEVDEVDETAVRRPFRCLGRVDGRLVASLRLRGGDEALPLRHARLAGGGSARTARTARTACTARAGCTARVVEVRIFAEVRVIVGVIVIIVRRVGIEEGPGAGSGEQCGQLTVGIGLAEYGPAVFAGARIAGVGAVAGDGELPRRAGDVHRIEGGAAHERVDAGVVGLQDLHAAAGKITVTAGANGSGKLGGELRGNHAGKVQTEQVECSGCDRSEAPGEPKALESAAHRGNCELHGRRRPQRHRVADRLGKPRLNRARRCAPELE